MRILKIPILLLTLAFLLNIISGISAISAPLESADKFRRLKKLVKNSNLSVPVLEETNAHMGVVHFHNGEASGPIRGLPGIFWYSRITSIVFGDLDNDQSTDGVAAIVGTFGGTGSGTDIIPFLSRGNKLVPGKGYSLNGQSGVDQLKILNKEVFVYYSMKAPEDAGSELSVKKFIKLKLNKQNRLVEIR